MDKSDVLLGDIRAYLRVLAANSLRPTAARVLDTYEKALVFSKLDGSTPQLRLEDATKVPQATISLWLSKFMEAGIVSPPNEIYRNHRSLFTIQELGINLGTLKKRSGLQSIVEPEGPGAQPA